MTSDEQRAAFLKRYENFAPAADFEYVEGVGFLNDEIAVRWWAFEKGWQTCAQQAPQARADEPVRIALLNLAAEVGGLLSLHDAFLREIHGNTNINILGRRLDEADAALAAAPALVEGKK